MRIGITSIQRQRNPWIVEWIAFHLLVGIDEFHVYAHRCTDGMDETLVKLSRRYPVNVYRIETDERPQLQAYAHAWAHLGDRVDWMAFIDGDEFLVPVKAATVPEALAPYAGHPMSALGVYWICYGSSGHVEDPGGLVMEQFRRHSERSFVPNRHMKTLLRGGQRGVQFNGAHLFATPNGTFDEQLRPIASPFMHDMAQAPSWDVLRVNHYVTQHWDFFKRTKQTMGAADLSPDKVRPDDWFHHHDRNECDDGVSYRFLVRLKLKVRELQDYLATA